MPIVGGKKYPYTKAGKLAARKAARTLKMKEGGAVRTVKTRGAGAATRGLGFKVRD